MRRILFSIAFAALSISCSSSYDRLSGLRDRLASIADVPEACIGIAVISDEGDTLTVNNGIEYPLMSVMKFHQALGVCHELQQGHGSLDTIVHVDAEELHPGTWSPLRDLHPEGNIDISLRELLMYSLQQSDNNVCDILFDRFLSPAGLDEWLKGSTGIDGFSIRWTEADMMRDNSLAYGNWTTPYSAAALVSGFRKGEILSGEYEDFVSDVMIDCLTGSGRLAAPLAGTDAVIGHKTGSGYVDSLGRIVATNDIGFVVLPEGPEYSIAVFIRDSMLSPEDTENLIADISGVVYRYFSGL